MDEFLKKQFQTSIQLNFITFILVYVYKCFLCTYVCQVYSWCIKKPEKRVLRPLEQSGSGTKIRSSVREANAVNPWAFSQAPIFISIFIFFYLKVFFSLKIQQRKFVIFNNNSGILCYSVLRKNTLDQLKYK